MNKKTLRDKTDGYCVLCGNHIDEDKDLTKEHVHPKSRGGKGGKNIMPAHSHCNQEKADMTMEEYCIDLEYQKEEGRAWQLMQLKLNELQR